MACGDEESGGACELIHNYDYDVPPDRDPTTDTTLATLEVTGGTFIEHDSPDCGEWRRLDLFVEASDGIELVSVTGNLVLADSDFQPQRPNPYYPGRMVYYYDHDLSSVEARLVLRPVDSAGNRGTPVAVDVTETGCSAGGGAGGLGGGVLLLALAAVVRMMRR